MGRRKKKQTGRQRRRANRRRNRHRPNMPTLASLLPRDGFDWTMVDGIYLDLNEDVVHRLEDALYDTYGADLCSDIFDDVMFEVVLRGTELEDTVADTDPKELWVTIKESFRGSGSFAEHRRVTPETLHAFVAFAVEAREWNEDPRLNPEDEGILVRAVDELRSSLYSYDNHLNEWYFDYHPPRPAEAHRIKLEKREKADVAPVAMDVDEQVSDDTELQEDFAIVQDKLASLGLKDGAEE